METWMECGEEVLLNFFLPSIDSSIYANYDNLTVIPNSNYGLRSAKTGRTDGRGRTKFNRASAPHSIRVTATTLPSLFMSFQGVVVKEAC